MKKAVPRPTRMVLFVSVSGWLGGPGASLATVLANLPDEIAPALAAPLGGDLMARVQLTGRLVDQLSLRRRREEGPDIRSRLRSTATITKWMLRNRGALACVHANGSAELHLVGLGALLTRVPIVVWLHGSEAGAWDRRLGPLWRRLPLRHQFVAVSAVAARVAVDAGLADADEIEIIPNPIDPMQCRAPRTAAGPPGDIVVGFLGGAGRPDKGFQLLPEIVGSVTDARIRWLVVGSGPTGATDKGAWCRLRQAGGDRVIASGWARDVREAYSQCDIVLCPSIRESFSRVVVEAMANGLPVVASDIPAHRALLGGEAAGLLFSLDHPESAGKAVVRLARDGDLRRRLGEVGLARARDFEPGPIVSRLVELYGGAR
jgi:glycosyltransferase involved in cell wall biosynthesis